MTTYRMRQCTRCKDDWYDDEEFYRSSSTPWCIACEMEAGRKGDAVKRAFTPEQRMAKRERELARYHAKRAAGFTRAKSPQSTGASAS